MNILDRVETLGRDLREYVDLRKDHMVLTMTSRITNVSSNVITYAILGVLAFPIIFFSSMALGWYLGERFQSMPLGFLSVAGIYALIAAIAYFNRKSMIANPIVKNITDSIYSEEDNHDNRK